MNSGDHVDERRFARAVRPHDANELAPAPSVQRNVPQRRGSAVVALRRRSSSSMGAGPDSAVTTSGCVHDVGARLPRR